MSEITIKEIAKLAGVGVSTVSRVINDHPDVNSETKERVLNIIKEYNYVPNNSARNLKRSDSTAIALLVKGASNIFFTEIIGYMQREVEKHKYSTVLQSVGFEEDETKVALELVKEKRLRGIVFLGGYFVNRGNRLRELGVPYVLSTTGSKGTMPEGFDEGSYSSVTVDSEVESYRMTDYLIKLGHKKIVIITATEDDISEGLLRLKGYRKALSDNGLPPDDSLVLHMKPELEDYSSENGYVVMKEFLDNGGKCTAVFAISDTLAFGAMRAIHDAGLLVPSDISVAGFDGIKAGRYFIPSLTTIKQPIAEMSKATIDILFGLIEDEGVNKHEIFPGEFIEGESTTAYSL